MPSNFCFHVLGWNLSVYRWKWQCFFLDLPHHHSTPGANICTDNIEFSFFPAMCFPETYIFWRKDCFFALVPICYLFRNQIKKTLSKVVPLTLLWFCRNFASNSIFAAGMFDFSRDDYRRISTFICPCSTLPCEWRDHRAGSQLKIKFKWQVLLDHDSSKMAKRYFWPHPLLIAHFLYI